MLDAGGDLSAHSNSLIGGERGKKKKNKKERKTKMASDNAPLAQQRRSLLLTLFTDKTRLQFLTRMRGRL